ncbi:radical SAM protein [Nannocystis bainbridge]|uniref:Radical SAM protein n=1 Tax=Nannocystis bainbridge TaxID=2995303 RepID=A0ABT5E2P0_9BACT|nr:radical SAM protein [Nannocystis bainbridge]MDC0719660.1 radical SAM protein [Nannocystis bainbridge]
MPGLLDMILGYDCNLWCDYCTIGPELRGRAMSTAHALASLRQGRAQGLDALSLTGGEPTIRPDLLTIVRAGRTLGFVDIKVQSNGLMYAHGDNLARLLAAGATRLHVSVHTHRADRYEQLVRRTGTYAAMVGGLQRAVESGAALVVDLIVKRDTMADLPAAIEWLGELGVRAVDLWYVSLTDANAAHPESLPRMTEALPFVKEALARGREQAMTLRSLHVPRCLLGEDHPHAWDPGADEVVVVTPEATFALKDSRLAGRVKVPACAGCPFEQVCPGVRPDYLARFGDGEIAAARGQAASRGPTHLPIAP